MHIQIKNVSFLCRFLYNQIQCHFQLLSIVAISNERIKLRGRSHNKMFDGKLDQILHIGTLLTAALVAKED